MHRNENTNKIQSLNWQFFLKTLSIDFLNVGYDMKQIVSPTIFKLRLKTLQNITKSYKTLQNVKNSYEDCQRIFDSMLELP